MYRDKFIVWGHEKVIGHCLCALMDSKSWLKAFKQTILLQIITTCQQQHFFKVFRNEAMVWYGSISTYLSYVFPLQINHSTPELWSLILNTALSSVLRYTPALLMNR